MAYTTNPKLPRLRREAANRVIKENWSSRQTARYYGYHQSTIVRWVAKARQQRGNTIPTEVSRPKSHPRQLSAELVNTIIQYRLKHRRCAEVLHYLLMKDGYVVSLSSVKRTLRRQGLTRYSRWKKWHQYPERPKATSPGVLVEIDTIHDGPATDRLYIYTLLDVCSRWAHATAVGRINGPGSVKFLVQAQRIAPFTFQTVQSDHGSEFAKWFSKQLTAAGLNHRHSRVRTPTDNGHLERFNRTIQEECLSRVPRSLKAYQQTLPEYLHFYNAERPHMALAMRSPLEVMQRYWLENSARGVGESSNQASTA